MSSQKPILLVEDNPDDIELTLMAFKEARIANPIDVVTNGTDALDYLFAQGAYASRDGSVQPVAVLLDLKLPRLSGLEVLERMRADERTRRTPVVILTSSKEQSDLARGYDLGTNSYVQKPVDFDQFVAAARQLGLYWTVLNEEPPTKR
jgi:two-component system response regulator